MVKFLRYSKIFSFYEAIAPYIKYSLHVANTIDSKKALILAPHGDDESIGCGGAVKKIVSGGAKVTLAVLTDGGTLRANETNAASKILGIDKIISLELKEESLENNNTLTEKLHALIADEEPDTIFMPFLLDNHTDHRGINKALLNLNLPLAHKIMIYAYSVWMPVYPNFLLDIGGDLWETKKNAISAYRSQTESRDYAEMAYSIARYWAIVKGSGYELLESYWRGTLKEYTKLGKAVYKEYKFDGRL